jgi:hypothetical protein
VHGECGGEGEEEGDGDDEVEEGEEHAWIHFAL